MMKNDDGWRPLSTIAECKKGDKIEILFDDGYILKGIFEKIDQAVDWGLGMEGKVIRMRVSDRRVADIPGTLESGWRYEKEEV